MGNGGLTTASNYPYKAVQQTCDTALESDHVVTIPKSPSYRSVWTDAQMQKAVYTSGPVAIGIQSAVPCFQQYSSGILTPENCNCGNAIDHAVTVVGWGEENGIKYWKVRNSWGSNWGEAGYVRMQRTSQGMCGMYTQAAYPSSALLSAQCSSNASMPQFCEPAPMLYSKTANGTCVQSAAGLYRDSTCNTENQGVDSSGTLPVWAWVLIGVGAALALLALVYCCSPLCSTRQSADRSGYVPLAGQ